ncbi:hypothetical protein WR25_18652 isoform A [Diploscapter pachys]|uniref:Uncharacterized protein n=1 Tax=Diploscapter pachys TaxID=2018661 RepID=A0A2A2LJR2_9BILA|nr:hypothetical protein WR25_18652 isoform A [Diploscapter pachys]
MEIPKDMPQSQNQRKPKEEPVQNPIPSSNGFKLSPQPLGRNQRNRNIFDDFADLDYNTASILESAVKITQIVRLAENGSPTLSTMNQFEELFAQTHPHFLKIMRCCDEAYTLFRPVPVPSHKLLTETAAEISVLCDISMAEKLNRYKLSHQGRFPETWWDLNRDINIYRALERSNLEYLKGLELNGRLDGFSDLAKKRDDLYIFHSDSGFSYLFGEDILVRLPLPSAIPPQLFASETEESVPESTDGQRH